MANVFISYSHRDLEFRDLVKRALEKKGHTVWTDELLVGGQNWKQVLTQRLNSMDAVVVLFSPNAVLSQWVIYEAREGARRKKLIPLYLGAADDLWEKARVLRETQETPEIDEAKGDFIEDIPASRKEFEKEFDVHQKLHVILERGRLLALNSPLTVENWLAEAVVKASSWWRHILYIPTRRLALGSFLSALAATLLTSVAAERWANPILLFVLFFLGILSLRLFAQAYRIEIDKQTQSGGGDVFNTGLFLTGSFTRLLLVSASVSAFLIILLDSSTAYSFDLGETLRRLLHLWPVSTLGVAFATVLARFTKLGGTLIVKNVADG